MTDFHLIPYIIIMASFYLLPTVIAYWRKHAYRHVIFALNILGGVTGVGWIVAIIWAVWPSNKSLVDPVLGNVTGTGYRNAGDTMGAVSFGQSRGFDEEREAYEQSRRGAPAVDPRAR
jgi:Superinfection immunity protein